ncbi:MAG: hypothetical protein WCC26_00540 [Terracidiphilus sp.]
MYSSPLAEILRATIRRVEENVDISPDYPSLLVLKRDILVLMKVAAIEAEEIQELSEDASEISAEPEPVSH